MAKAKTPKFTTARDPFLTPRVSQVAPNSYVVNPIDLGFTPQKSYPGYTGSSWDYGGQSNALKPSPLQVAPIAAPVGHNPFDQVISQARAWLQNPNQMRQAANQQVGAQVQAALGASNASGKAEQQQLAALEQRAAGFSQALANIGQPAGQQVYDQYLGAANTIANLGGGLTGQVAADQQAASDQATAAVQQQLGSSANVGGYDPAALRSTAYYTGATLPATTLAQQAVGQAAATRSQYLAGAGQVDQVRRDYEAQAVQALNQRAAERASIVAQRPALFQDALKANRDDQAQVQAHLDSLTTNSVNWKTNADAVAYQKLQDKKLLAYKTLHDALDRKERATTRAASAKATADANTARVKIANARAASDAAVVAERGREFDVTAKQKASDALAKAGQATDRQTYLNKLADIQETAITHVAPNGKLVGGYLYDPKTKSIIPASTYYQYLANGDTLRARQIEAAQGNLTKKQIANAANKTRVATTNATNATRVQTAGIGANAAVDVAKMRVNAQTQIAQWGNATKDADSRRRFNIAQQKLQGKGAFGGLTAESFTNLQNKALEQLDKLRYGVPGGQRKTADGTGYQADPSKPAIPGVDYNQALIHLGEMGPPTPAWENYVLSVVNNLYPPGENGRPLTDAGQAWLSRRMLQAAQKFGKAWGGLPSDYFVPGLPGLQKQSPTGGSATSASAPAATGSAARSSASSSGTGTSSGYGTLPRGKSWPGQNKKLRGPSWNG